MVEILVSIVLLGTAVGGTLTALRTTIVSSQRDEELAIAESWLREAEERLHFAPYVSCTSADGANVKAAYLAVIQAAPAPTEWGGGTIDMNSLEFWGRDGNRHEGWRPDCDTGATSRVAQLVQFYVLSPDGDTTRRIQVVKRG